jgi:hypothetical protein
MRVRGYLGSLVCLFVLSGAVYAQEFRGRVQGLTTDQSGGVIPGATAALKNDQTGVEIKRQTNSEGRYLFDYVDPSTYTLTVEMTGFKTAIQKNIVVPQRGDVTVDIKLQVGELNQVVTVMESPVAVQFNTASRDLTLDKKMVAELPSPTRNPWQFALLDPAVVNRGSLIETQPYHHRTANEMDIGGGTKYRNDILLDGTPLIAGNKLGYTPPMDAVAEYTIQQNSVDAEFGHSSGGIAIITMKSGGNEIHGTAYASGRHPSWNAISDRPSHKHNNNPYWTAGGSVGFPIIKNKLFVFGVFEKIENTQTVPGNYTLPTALERQGDFSQSFNADGSLRVIYDPMTTRLAPGGASYIRDKFDLNKIPQDRWDQLATKIMGNLWGPNNAGDDKTGLNNFKYNQENIFHYYNFSTRADWQIRDNWKAFARISRIKTDQDSTDFTGGQDPLKLRNVQGSKRNGWNIAADTVYTFTPKTTINLRGAFYKVEDKRDYPAMNIGDYSDFWSDGWWQPYMATRPLVYAPYLVVDTTARGTFGVQNFWYQEPQGYSAHARLDHYFTKHMVKAGGEMRWKRGQAARFRFFTGTFTSKDTANTFSSPNAKTGSPWASFLLGVMDTTQTGATLPQVQYTPMQKANTEMYAFYIQDDWKVNNRLTLSLGLRYEYEGGYWDPENRIQQNLDLTDPIPGMAAAIDPLIPANIKAYMAQSTGQNTYSYTGAFSFTSSKNKRGTSADKKEFMPRIGLAYRLDGKTAMRIGYARFYTPNSLIMPDRDANGEIPLGAFSPSTLVNPTLSGIPQAFLENPFPQGLTPAYGKSYGRYTQLGDAITIDKYEQRPPISDRINFSVQRELPGSIVLDVTYILNWVSRDQWTKQLNLMDPRLTYKYRAAMNATVNNPFYNYGTVDTFPGALRKQSKVSISSLLVPYPQYGTLLQTSTDMRKSSYRSFQIRVQKPFAKGISFVASYGHTTQRTQVFFDTQDEYDGRLTWMDGAYSPPGGTGTNLTYANDPKHRFTVAATWEVPVGKGRMLGKNMSRPLDMFIGGWQLSGTWTASSGQTLAFGTMTAPRSVKKIGKVGAGNYWFDKTGFDVQPAYTRRTNPWYYSNLTGPGFTNLDLSIYKRVRVNERFQVEARLEAYNAVNEMNWANPTVDISKLNSDFGRTSAQASGYYGRQLQVAAKLYF